MRRWRFCPYHVTSLLSYINCTFMIIPELIVSGAELDEKYDRKRDEKDEDGGARD